MRHRTHDRPDDLGSVPVVLRVVRGIDVRIRADGVRERHVALQPCGANATTTGPGSPPGRSSKDSGTVSASTNIAAIAPNIAARPMPSSARTTFPSHA